MSARLVVPSHTTRMRELLGLAWPAVLSYILNNTYRINDQFWIQGLGEKAQTAVGATFFVQVLNFSLIFLGVGGTLALVSRSTGARDPVLRDSVARHALVFELVIGALLTVLVVPLAGSIATGLGLAGEAAEQGEQYLRWLYVFMAPMAVFPALDAIYIGRGNTRIPMTLQLVAVSLNYVLNPLLIYGRHAAEHVDAPGVHMISRLADALGLEGSGIAGAAIATGVARTTTVIVGVLLLAWPMGTRLIVPGGISPSRSARRLASILGISVPSSASIAVYAGVYVLLLRFVLTPLGDEVTAGLGVGFQVFEGVAFPCYLGVAIAGSSLVGRELGARNRQGVLEVIGSARFAARMLGLIAAAVFWFLGPPLAEAFTQDEGVARETALYVGILAFSQYFVAIEAANEKVLLGAGQTRAILWISPLGNLLRVPLGWLLAVGPFGLGAAGVWWAINLTTCLKAFLFWRLVQDGEWLERAWNDGMAPAPAPRTRAH